MKLAKASLSDALDGRSVLITGMSRGKRTQFTPFLLTPL